MNFSISLQCFGCDVVWDEPDETTDETFIEIAAHYLTHGEAGIPWAERVIKSAARNTEEAMEQEMERIRHALSRIR